MAAYVLAAPRCSRCVSVRHPLCVRGTAVSQPHSGTINVPFDAAVRGPAVGTEATGTGRSTPLGAEKRTRTRRHGKCGFFCGIVAAAGYRVLGQARSAIVSGSSVSRVHLMSGL